MRSVPLVRLLAHPLSVLLRHLFRDTLALIQFPSGLGALQQSFGRSEVAGFHEGFCLVLRADVVGWPHLLNAQILCDGPEGVASLPQREQCLDGDFRAFFRVHRIRVRVLKWGDLGRA